MSKNDPILLNHDGTLTRAGALAAAREKFGDLGMISGDEKLPRLVWAIGEVRTMGKGRTWEEALRRTKPMREKRLEIQAVAIALNEEKEEE